MNEGVEVEDVRNRKNHNAVPEVSAVDKENEIRSARKFAMVSSLFDQQLHQRRK